MRTSQRLGFHKLPPKEMVELGGHRAQFENHFGNLVAKPATGSLHDGRGEGVRAGLGQDFVCVFV